MKRLIIPAIAATLMAGFASCSSDELAVDSGKYGMVTITAQLPGGISRAYADGTTATRLQYAVYDEKAKEFVGVNDANDVVGTATFVNLETTVTVQLAKAKSYKLYFWADAGQDSPYTFDYSNKQIKVDYSNVTGNMESYDAFYGTAQVEVNGSLNQTVTLVRPFAQLNIGTNDLAAAKRTGFDAKNVTVTVSGLNTLFSLEDGNATGDATATVTFAKAALPDGQTFPVDGYDYLSMNYILVGNEKTTTDVTMIVDNGDGVATPEATYATVPVQQNYRTNIYGALLTDPANFTVQISPDFNTPDYNKVYNVTDAASLKSVLTNGKGGVINVESNISTTEQMLVTSGNYEINLGDYTIDTPGNIWHGNSWALINVRGGNVTINASENGGIAAAQGDSYAIAVSGANASLTVNGGTYLGDCSAVYVTEGTATLNGGTYKIWPTTYGTVYLLNLSDANAYKTANIIVTGGTFYGYNPAEPASESSHQSMVAAGYKSVSSEVDGSTVWTVVAE